MTRFYTLFIAFFLLTSTKAERIANHYEIHDLGKSANLEGKIQIEFEVYDDYNEICNKAVSFYHNKELLLPDCNDSLCILFTDSVNFKCRVNKSNTYPVYISEKLKRNHRYNIKVHLQGRRENVRKPVIYIHTNDTLPLKIGLTTPCEEIFSYPELSVQNEWEVVSYPNQSILVGENAYRYLFWDGTIPTEALQGTLNNASVIEKDSLLTYLNTSLSTFGFSSKEKADFISYWYPMMQPYAGIQIQFMCNEEVHEFSKLENNKALPIYQFYMIWTPIPSTTNVKPYYSDKSIPTIDTSENYILEWGGVKLNHVNLFENENEF
jgi:hypothetical protein